MDWLPDARIATTVFVNKEELKMPRFYFTYGSEGQPFVGGWTVVEAPDFQAAQAAFQVFYPCKVPGCLNCCSVYTEESFKKTSMSVHGNIGARCHEIIRIQREKTNAYEEPGVMIL